MADNIFITSRSQNNQIPSINAVTINLRNQQFLPLSFCNDDNHLTSPITENQPVFIKIATRPNHTITVLNKLKITNIRKLFHIELLMFITLNDDIEAIKDIKTVGIT